MNKKISSKTWLVVFALIGCLLWAWVSRAEIVVCSYLIRYGVSFSSVRIEDRLLTVKLRSNGTVHCTQDDINGMEVVFNLAVRDKAVAGKIDNVQMIITGKTLKGYPPFEGTDLTFPSDDPPMDFTWVLQEASSNFAANYGPPTAEELESRRASEAASTEETVVESGEIEETETDTEDKEVAKSEERIEIDVKLESTEQDYFVFVDELVRGNDCYIITGVKKHKNTLFINNYQKSLLDAGIALNVIYGEEKIACFTATLTDEYDSHTGSRRPEIYYTVEGLDGFERYMASFETEGGMYGIDQELLDSDRYYGLAFYFREPYSWMQYLPVLEENYKVSVSGAVMIDTLDGSIRGETMTIDQFYEENRDMYKIRVCVENGEVVKLEEWYVP